MLMTKLDVIKTTITASTRQLKGTWTLEDGPSTVVIASSIVEDLAPDAHQQIVSHLGHDNYFLHKEGEEPYRLATGDPLLEGPVKFHPFDIAW